jgi:hypothetical protein
MTTGGWVRKALTRERIQRGRVVTEDPDEKLVVVVKFGLATTACFCALEFAHVLLLGSWNSEIFTAISGLSGTLSGIFVGKRS